MKTIEEKDLDRADYAILRNGHSFRPLGWENLIFIGGMTVVVFCIFYFVWPLRRSRVTMFERFGYDGIYFAMPLVLIVLIIVYCVMKTTDDDYVGGRKVIFSAIVRFHEKGKYDFYTTVSLMHPHYGCSPLKINRDLISEEIKDGIKYDFEVAPKSKIILKMKRSSDEKS